MSSLLAVISIPLLYRFQGYKDADGIAWLKDREEKEHQQLLARLTESRTELINLQLNDAVEQTGVLGKIISDYHSVIRTRFSGRKRQPLTYLRASYSVQKTCIYNLSQMVAVGHSMETIRDIGLKKQQIKYSTAQQRQSKQETVYQQQEKLLDDLLEENRELFNALMETAVEVANIKSFSDFNRLDTLSRLVSLAEIAKKTKKIEVI